MSVVIQNRHLYISLRSRLQRLKPARPHASRGGPKHHVTRAAAEPTQSTVGRYYKNFLNRHFTTSSHGVARKVYVGLPRAGSTCSRAIRRESCRRFRYDEPLHRLITCIFWRKDRWGSAALFVLAAFRPECRLIVQISGLLFDLGDAEIGCSPTTQVFLLFVLERKSKFCCDTIFLFFLFLGFHIISYWEVSFLHFASEKFYMLIKL